VKRNARLDREYERLYLPAALVRESLATGHTLKELALAQKLLTADEYEALLAAAIQPNL